MSDRWCIQSSIIATGGEVTQGAMTTNIAAECNLIHALDPATLLSGGPNLIGSSHNPDFIAPNSGDFHLGASSDALGFCTTGLTEDLDGNSRSAPYDMGALERP